MLKLKMEQILNPKLICDVTIFTSSCLATESRHVLYLLHTRYTKNKKHQENTKFSTRDYHIKHIKYVQNKNINMDYGYMKVLIN